MSSVENLGIRVSLIGGKAAALQSLDVAKGVQAIGTEAEVAGVNALICSIHLSKAWMSPGYRRMLHTRT